MQRDIDAHQSELVNEVIFQLLPIDSCHYLSLDIIYITLLIKPVVKFMRVSHTHTKKGIQRDNYTRGSPVYCISVFVSDLWHLCVKLIIKLD